VDQTEVQILTENVNLRMQYINSEILITEMGVSNEAKNVIPLKFLRKIKNKMFFPLPVTYGSFWKVGIFITVYWMVRNK
jgi:hypothetical protein